jgi:F-type H+-transporting ATPase subunit b
MDISFPAIIFQAINFGVVAFVIWKFLLGPIQKVLEERSTRIEQGLSAAESNLKKEQEMEKKVKTELQQARDEAREIIAQGKKQAEKEASAIVEKAREVAKKSLEGEQRAFEAKMHKEAKDLESRMADLVAQATKQVLAGALTEADQKKIIEAQLKELKGMTLA